MVLKYFQGASFVRALATVGRAKHTQANLNHVRCYLACSPSRNVIVHSSNHCSIPLVAQSSHTWRLIPQRYLTCTSKNRKDVSGIFENSSVLQTKPRLQRWRRQKSAERGHPVAAFSTAEGYDLEGLKVAIAKQELYNVEEEEAFKVQESDHQGDDVVHIKARYNVEQEPREVFFFREGTAVFWNVSELEISNFLRFLKPYECQSYKEKLVMNEKELMSYVINDIKKTVLRNDVIELANSSDNSLVKYSFSNAIALSVKLGIWEASLEKFIDSIEFITEDLKTGRKIKMSREEVLRKQGELFALRHHINLSSDLLDTPDFYWDNEDLERFYLQTANYFCINRRTRVMNEKISHCAELVELVSSHLSDKHHIRLEWMIIVLIMVEVCFEALHYLR